MNPVNILLRLSGREIDPLQGLYN